MSKPTSAGFKHVHTLLIKPTVVVATVFSSMDDCYDEFPEDSPCSPLRPSRPGKRCVSFNHLSLNVSSLTSRRSESVFEFKSASEWSQTPVVVLVLCLLSVTFIQQNRTGSLLQSGWSTGAKTNHLLPSVSVSGSEQNLMMFYSCVVLPGEHV